jgi:putative hemolysin
MPFRRQQSVAIAKTSAFTPIVEGRYEARIAETAAEIASALRLRHAVFNVELGARQCGDPNGVEFDAFDFKCVHLIVRDIENNETVGTYRLNTLETAKDTSGFYSSGEFDLSQLPSEIIANGIEIGRACVAADHRNTRVLLLLWKALLAYLQNSRKRFFFGCCSIFSTDESIGAAAYRQLVAEGHLHNDISVEPVRNSIDPCSASDCFESSQIVELPALFNMYLRLGAKVCSPPIIDREFGTIDLFVVFDIRDLNDKYRRLLTK